jgi:hypothetical protein
VLGADGGTVFNPSKPFAAHRLLYRPMAEANALLLRYLFMAESLSQVQDVPGPENIPLIETIRSQPLEP